jgi:DNA-binding MarR family transcriptional regulator
MATSSTDVPDVRTRLGYLLKHAHARLEQLHAEALEPFGIDARELGVLLVLAGDTTSSQHEVAQRLGVDRTTMVAMIDVLEGKDIVSRQPDPADRRRNLVSLTAKGTRALAGATHASDDAERQLLASLSSREQQQLRAALRAVVADGHADEG